MDRDAPFVTPAGPDMSEAMPQTAWERSLGVLTWEGFQPKPPSDWLAYEKLMQRMRKLSCFSV